MLSLKALVEKKMNKFDELAKKAKELVSSNPETCVKTREKIDRIYISMSLIAMDLKPVHWMIQEQSAKHAKLFADLEEFFNQRKQEK